MLYRVVAVTAFAAVGLASTDPFVGTWRARPETVKAAGQQMKLEDLGLNKFRMSGGIESYTIITDGTEQPTILGSTVSYTRPQASVIQMIEKKNGKVVKIHTWTLSGDTFTFKDKQIADDGTISDYEVIWKRVGNGSGWTGTWQSGDPNMNQATPIELVFAPGEGNTLTLNGEIMRFDGTEFPVSGVPVGMKATATRTGPKTLEVTIKLQGKVFRRERLQVSPDGKNMTFADHLGDNPAVTVVFERK